MEFFDIISIIMAEISIFAFSNYRVFIRTWIDSQGSVRGLLTQLCREIHCQNAHISRVIQEKVHLTMDQAFRICKFMGLNKAESVYFMKLAEHDRAGDPEYRRQLKDELSALRQAQENFNQRHSLKKIENLQTEMAYYSSWHWSAIHFITGISKYKTPENIAQRLGLSEYFVKCSLEVLEQFGLVKRTGEFWVINVGSIHLPKTSPMNSVQHGNWRNRAVLKSQDISDDGLHYTIVQCVSEDDFEKIKQLFLKSIDDYKKIANPSPSEELICFSLDFFRV